MFDFWRKTVSHAQAVSALRVVEYIDELREGDGNSVEILCQNSEADTRRDLEAVDICADWTNWVSRRFYAATVEDALAAAVRAKRIQQEKKDG